MILSINTAEQCVERTEINTNICRNDALLSQYHSLGHRSHLQKHA